MQERSIYVFPCFLGPSSANEKEPSNDIRGSIPPLLMITHRKYHQVNILDDLLVEAGAIYILDRDYLDFARLYKIHQSLAFFVTRAKSQAWNSFFS
jgi:hypothetical protein